jgi:hypothetical protein
MNYTGSGERVCCPLFDMKRNPTRRYRIYKNPDEKGTVGPITGL